MKILQIIPAPADMWIKHEENGAMFFTRVVCLALVEDENGERVIYPADILPYNDHIDINRDALREIVYSATDPNNFISPWSV